MTNISWFFRAQATCSCRQCTDEGCWNSRTFSDQPPREAVCRYEHVPLFPERPSRTMKRPSIKTLAWTFCLSTLLSLPTRTGKARQERNKVNSTTTYERWSSAKDLRHFARRAKSDARRKRRNWDVLLKGVFNRRRPLDSLWRFGFRSDRIYTPPTLLFIYREH